MFEEYLGGEVRLSPFTQRGRGAASSPPCARCWRRFRALLGGGQGPRALMLSCVRLSRPHEKPRLLSTEILQAGTLQWAAISFSGRSLRVWQI